MIPKSANRIGQDHAQREKIMALISVAEALARVLANASPLPAESVPLSDAFGRVPAEDLAALRTQPPAAVSAMDGYAVRADDVAKAPVKLKLIGEVAAGHPFDGEVKTGETARIFTGGVMPKGSDTVVIQELAARQSDTVTIQKPTTKGRNVRDQGIDFTQGRTLLSKGRRLTDRDLMLAAAMNYPRLSVHRRPKVAVLGTGDELVAPGATPASSEIVYSNGFALIALARKEGAEVIDLGIARDRIEEIAAAVRRAREWDADILLTSGGASVGEHDLVQRALASEGLDLSFWRVALRPGRPMMHGKLGAMQVLGVPGNPVSSYVCAFLFLVPLIRRLTGRADIEHHSESARLGRDLPANDERADYLRATLTPGPDGTVATPLPAQDSSLMAPLARADCLLIREPNAPSASSGSSCVILKLGL
jgi:molybdopterin molybdotransferase